MLTLRQHLFAHELQLKEKLVLVNRIVCFAGMEKLEGGERISYTGNFRMVAVYRS